MPSARITPVSGTFTSGYHRVSGIFSCTEAVMRQVKLEKCILALPTTGLRTF